MTLTWSLTATARRAAKQIGETFVKVERLMVPSRALYQQAGPAFWSLRAKGREVRRASLVNDVLIALSARELGATVVTNDSSDFDAISRVIDFSFAVV